MNDQTDSQLLCAYAENRSEAAFAELVRRHVDFVYSAARRMVIDPHLAEDVTQGVFVAFAKNARQLTNRSVLSGWLHRTAQNIAAQTVRTIERRRAREQEAVAMNELLAHESDAGWENIAPHLDIALSELSEPDRDALLLRYFERKSAREMAQTLGTSEEAAQKRVNRAVERLREFFSKRNVTIGASGLAVVISANAVQAAPIGLAASISTAVTIATITIATHSTMHWLNFKSVAVILVATVTAGTGTHLLQQREAARLRSENQNLKAQQKHLTAERDTAISAASQKSDEMERLQKNQSELLRLRGEVGKMRQQLESQKLQASQQQIASKNAPKARPHAPGTYISKDQMTYAGYETPEAALETMDWAMLKGTYEQVNESLGPELLKGELNDPKGRERFEEGRKKLEPLFKGMQLMAKKTLADDKVEIKAKLDYDPAISQLNADGRPVPSFFIQPMLKVGDQWKLGGSTRPHRNDWEQTGQIETFIP